MKLRSAIRYAALGAVIGIPGAALAQPPSAMGQFTVDGAGAISDTSGVCADDVSDANFLQQTCTIGGDTFFRTIIAEPDGTTGTFAPDAADFVNESFVIQNGGGGVALNNQVDLGGGGMGNRAIASLNTGSFAPTGTDNVGTSIFTGNFITEIDFYQSVPGLTDSFRMKESATFDDDGNGELLAFSQDMGGSAGSSNYLELDLDKFAEFTSRGDFLHAFADPAQVLSGTATGPDGSTVQFDGGDSVSWTRFASNEGGDPSQIAFSEFVVTDIVNISETIGGDVLGGTSADWVTFGGNVPYYDFGADAFFGGDLQSGL